jgi:hypothetical protein
MYFAFIETLATDYSFNISKLIYQLTVRQCAPISHKVAAGLNEQTVFARKNPYNSGTVSYANPDSFTDGFTFSIVSWRKCFRWFICLRFGLSV